MAFFPSLKQNFIACRSSKMSSRPDCIFEIHQLWQSGFSRVYSNCSCNCSFEPEIIKTSQSSHKMYRNKILNSQESTTILNNYTKKSGNILKAPRIYFHWSLLQRPPNVKRILPSNHTITDDLAYKQQKKSPHVYDIEGKLSFLERNYWNVGRQQETLSVYPA